MFAWTSLSSYDFSLNATLLCRYFMFVVGKVVEMKFCPTVGGGRLDVKGRNRTGHRWWRMAAFNPSRYGLVGEVKESFRSGAE